MFHYYPSTQHHAASRPGRLGAVSAEAQAVIDSWDPQPSVAPVVTLNLSEAASLQQFKMMLAYIDAQAESVEAVNSGVWDTETQNAFVNLVGPSGFGVETSRTTTSGYVVPTGLGVLAIVALVFGEDAQTQIPGSTTSGYIATNWPKIAAYLNAAAANNEPGPVLDPPLASTPGPQAAPAEPKSKMTAILAGAAAGGIGGFFVGGPMGAALGAAGGAALGAVVA